MRKTNDSPVRMKLPYAGLTRVSIILHQKSFQKWMDCRVKPGNDDLCLEP
jgi:hypothetical protein